MITLETRPYGKTGEQVTVVGLGGAFLNQQSYEDGVATVRRALELGITYFDTSPVYCEGASQAILGEALHGRTEPYMLATKLGHFGRRSLYRSPDGLRAQIGENLRLLRRNSVDTLQVHESDMNEWWWDTSDTDVSAQEIAPDYANAPAMQILREARDEGKCRFIGITGNSAGGTLRVFRHVEVDTYLLAFNYDLIWREARREAIPAACKREAALILGGVFRCGQMVKMRPEMLTSSEKWVTPELRDRFGRLYAIQADCGLSLVTLTIRYLLKDPRFATILVGATTPAEIEESVAAAEAGPLPPELHETIEELGLP